MFNFKVSKEQVAVSESKNVIRNEVVIHITSQNTYIYKDYYERDFEGTMGNPTSVIYLRDEDHNTYYIHGDYVIVPIENENDIEQIIKRFNLKNVIQLSLK